MSNVFFDQHLQKYKDKPTAFDTVESDTMCYNFDKGGEDLMSLKRICDLINVGTERIQAFEEAIGLGDMRGYHPMTDSYESIKINFFNENPTSECYEILLAQSKLLKYLGIVYNFYREVLVNESEKD